MNLNWTWNGEKILISDRLWTGYSAILDGYDPTPWDYDTPVRGPHTRIGEGNSLQQAACDLIEQIWEMG